MIISKTPFRISFFGGGTDYPAWFENHGGKVLSTTINRFCYLTCRYLPPFFKHKYRIAYSKVEAVQSIQDIEHPSVRAVLDYMGCEQGLEIHHDGDLPARSGLGSSSSFTVGLLNSLHAMKGEYRSAEQLAKEAIHIEQEVLHEYVGSQDQRNGIHPSEFHFLAVERTIRHGLKIMVERCCPRRLTDFVILPAGICRRFSSISIALLTARLKRFNLFKILSTPR